jgi:hypothetical protein
LVQQIDQSGQTNYLQVDRSGGGGHNTGFEINTESKPFSHYVQSPDGVRLGCYGYLLNGKKYSTVYVSDSRGYRVIPTFLDVVPVYPRNGEPRTASFASVFNESEKFSQNIREFFPTICRDIDPGRPVVTSPPRPPPPVIVTKAPDTTVRTTQPTQPLTRPTTTTPKPIPVIITTRPTDPPIRFNDCPVDNTCKTGIKLLSSDLVANCQTLAINIPTGAFSQSDLNKLSNQEILQKIISILSS